MPQSSLLVDAVHPSLRINCFREGAAAYAEESILRVKKSAVKFTPPSAYGR